MLFSEDVRLLHWLHLSECDQAGLQQWGMTLRTAIPAMAEEVIAVLQQQAFFGGASLSLYSLKGWLETWLYSLADGRYDAAFWEKQKAIGAQYAEHANLPLAVTIGFHRFRRMLPQHLQAHFPDGGNASALQGSLLRLLDACQHVMQCAYTQARLHHLSKSLRGVLQHYDLATFFEQAADLARNLAGADGAGLILPQAGQLHYRFFHGLSQHYFDLAETVFPIGTGNAGQAFEQNQVIYLRDYPASPTAMPNFMAAGLQASLAIPLPGPEGPIGVLVLSWFNTPAPERITADHWELLRLLADLLGAQRYREKLEKRLESLAGEDLLTGLPNRREAKARVHRAMARTYRHQRLFALFFLDLDGFKAINDQMGHHQGDLVLQQVSRDLLAALRADDSLMRYAGDEFLVIAEDLRHVREVEELADRLVAVVHREVQQDNARLPLTVSMGIVIYPLDDGDPEAMIHQADLAMYAAKQAGGDRWAFYDAQLGEKAQKNHEIVNAIRQSSAFHDFVLYWQPIVTLPDRRITGAEALLRWRHPERGLLTPGDFIDALEGNRALMQAAGRWILAEAFATAADWHGRGYGLDIHINVAAAQLDDPQFLSMLRSLLQQYPAIQPEHLWLEIVERVALQDRDRSAALAAGCQALGIRFTLDDFGTGAAPMQYLVDLDCGGIKLDKSMINAACQNARHGRFLKAMVDMARDLELHVVAEGVEDEAALALLETIGVSQVQGYLLGRPMPREALEACLDQPVLPSSGAEMVGGHP